MEQGAGKQSEQQALDRFESLVMPHATAAYNLARYLMRNEDEARDATQEAFLRAYRAFDRFEARNPLAWLLKIVRNVCYSALERNRNGAAAISFDEEIHGGLATPGAPDSLSPDGLLDREQQGLRVRAMISELPHEFREVIVLRELEELSYQEIAGILDVPLGTVMSRISRGRRWLRTLAVDEAEGDGL